MIIPISLPRLEAREAYSLQSVLDIPRREQNELNGAHCPHPEFFEYLFNNISMGLFSAFFKKNIICPLCKNEIDVKTAKTTGEIEILGKDIEGYIHLKHRTGCGAHIVWDTLSGKTFEKDIPEEFLK